MHSHLKDAIVEPDYFEPIVIVDTREQTPFTFQGIHSQGSPVIIKISRASLKTGDYSLQGFEDEIAIERKEISDLFNCCGNDRERFEQQVERLNEIKVFSAVVVEADEFAIRTYLETKMSPRSVLGTIDAFEQRYRNVHFLLCRGRGAAEAKTFRILRRFWIDKQK